jgi:hypothetical protein
MSLNNTFSRHALKQFVSLLDGVTATTDLEEILWAKIQAQPVASSSIKIPVNVLRKALKKSKIELPYLPSVINYNIGCTALKVTGGLYIPCCAKCVEDSQFCAACEKHEAKYGVLSDRGEIGTYTDPSDKHETSYGTWLNMNDFTIDDVNEALNEEGFKISIPAEYLTVNSKRIIKEKKSRKGRPKSTKKEVVEDESESEEAVEPPPPDFGSDDEEEAPKPIKKKEAAVKLPVLKITAHSDDDSDDDVPLVSRLPVIGAKHAPAAILTAPSKSDTEEEEPKKAKKPKAKKVEAKGEEAKGEEEPKKPKSKAKKFEAKEENSDEDSEEKPKKAKSKAKKNIEEAKIEDAKVEEAKLDESEAKEPKEPKEPKKAKKPKVKKSEEESAESDEAKVEEPKKPKAKAKKAEVDEAKGEEDPKKPKAKKPIMASLNEALTKFTKENEAAKEVASRFTTELGTEDFEQETTYVNGVQYKLNGKCLVNEDGEIAGRLLDDGTAQMHAQPPPDEDDDDDDAWSNAASGR